MNMDEIELITKDQLCKDILTWIDGLDRDITFIADRGVTYYNIVIACDSK